MGEEKKNKPQKKQRSSRARNAMSGMQQLLIAGFVVLVLIVIVLVGYTILDTEGIGVTKGRLIPAAVQPTQVETQVVPPAVTVKQTEPAKKTPQERAAELMQTMTLEEKAYQLILATPYSVTQEIGLTGMSDSLKTALGEQPVGGFVFTDANIIDADALAAMISAMRGEIQLAPFFGTDRDGTAELQTLAVENVSVLGLTEELLFPELPEAYFKALPLPDDLLQLRVDFSGVILTEDYSLQADTAAVDAILAGCDMIFKPVSPKAAATAILTAIEAGRLTEQRIDESVLRILTVKYELGILS